MSVRLVGSGGVRFLLVERAGGLRRLVGPYCATCDRPLSTGTGGCASPGSSACRAAALALRTLQRRRDSV